MKRDRVLFQEITPRDAEPLAEARAVPRDTGVIAAREPRHRPRIRKELSAQLSTLDPNHDASYTLTSARTLDLADGGLGLAVDEPISVGQRVVVEIELVDGRWVERNGRVAWTSEDPSGSRFVGIQFDAVVTGFAAQATTNQD